MKLFYDHLLVPLGKVYAHIEHLEIDAKDKQELLDIIHDTTHHTVLDTILEHLHRDHHETFLEKLHHSPHDPELLSWLKSHVSDIESQILSSINQLNAQLHASISKENPLDK